MDRILAGRKRMTRNFNSRTVFLVVTLMMISAKGVLSYPTFQRLLLRSARRSVAYPPTSCRYLVSNTRGGKTDNTFGLKSQQLDAVEERTLEETTLDTDSKIQDVGLEKKVTNATSEESVTSTDTSISSSIGSVESESITASSWSRYLMRALRRGAGSVASTAGFLSSATTSIITDRAQFRRSRPTVEAFNLFLNSSGIDLELSPSLNVHLLRNVIVLGRIQKVLADRNDRREQAKAKRKIKVPSKEEALRYMRYSTAVYGNNMIAAAEMDARGKFDTRLLSPLTKTRISEHIGVPEDDIVLADVDYGGDGNHLRHFVAVDHANRKVVLSIRGTFTLSEIIVDVAAFSRKCLQEILDEWDESCDSLRDQMRLFTHTFLFDCS